MVELNAAELARQMVEPLRRDVALMQQVLERERRLQREVTGRLVAPVDAVFTLLQESAATMQRQAEALDAAGAALCETAALMKVQADLFERTLGTLHQPVALVESAAGLEAVPPPRRHRAPRNP